MESRYLKIENTNLEIHKSSILNHKSYFLRTQPCPVCQKPMGDMPGSRDAYCSNCGYKDPCCE